MNTREYRKRKELEESRHDAIQKMTSINPDFKPPADYKYVKQIILKLLFYMNVYIKNSHLIAIERFICYFLVFGKSLNSSKLEKNFL